MRPERAPARCTLIELLVALAIVALVATIVAVPLGAGRDAAALREASAELRTLLRSAHGEALTRNREIRFAVDGAGFVFDGVPRRFATEALVRGAVRVETSGIAFFPTGGSSGGRIFLSAGRRVGTIEVDAATSRLADVR